MTALAICDGTLGRSRGGRRWPKDILLKDGRVAEIAAPGKLKGRTARRCSTRPD